MSTGDYKVADISLADYGRKEIEIAEIESESWSLRTKEDEDPLCGVGKIERILPDDRTGSPHSVIADLDPYSS